MLQQRSLAIAMGLLSGFLLPACLWAQDTARLEGKVMDASGAAVPNAQVTARSASTAQRAQTTTDPNSGTFALSGLKIGQYTITVEAPGFQIVPLKFCK